MEKENKKGNDIDEDYLMSMMAGGVRKEGLASKTGVDSGSGESQTTIKKKRKAGSENRECADYEILFFKNPDGNARNGKSVYIRPEFHERLTRIVQVIGGDKISLYAYLDNVLEHHFREFGEEIKKTFDDKYKPIL
ncbi:DUF3408 domain-containing protein [Flavobacterium sp. ST-75]|uniref:DUF3408 domain-containing protein n=1 Tax=Flavobacterium rhizophilum TaxID=3163296 RepID=A0ABW8YB91_9FLAO